MHAAVVRRSCEVQGCRPRPRTRVGPTACEREESPAENQWIFYPSEASSSATSGQGDVFGGRWKDAATPRLWPLHATTAEFAQQVATTGRQTGKQGITTGLCRLRKPLAILTWGCQCGRRCNSQGGRIKPPARAINFPPTTNSRSRVGKQLEAANCRVVKPLAWSTCSTHRRDVRVDARLQRLSGVPTWSS